MKALIQLPLRPDPDFLLMKSKTTTARLVFMGGVGAATTNASSISSGASGPDVCDFTSQEESSGWKANWEQTQPQKGGGQSEDGGS